MSAVSLWVFREAFVQPLPLVTLVLIVHSLILFSLIALTYTLWHIGEISTPTMRGIVGFFFAFNLSCGVLVTSVMGLWMHWRWLSVICTIKPIIFIVGMICVPESPYFLMRKGW